MFLEPPPASRAEVRRAVHDVLDRPEFRQPKPSFLARARDWAYEQIARLVGELANGGRGAFVGWLVVGIALGVVGVLTWRFTRGMSRDPEVAAARAGVARRSGADWRADADAAERKGEWRQALRFRYRALVSDLAARGLVDEVPGRTTGEYRAEMARNAPAAAPGFGAASELFELAWYGNRPTGPDEAGRFRRLAGDVLVEVGT